MIDTLNSSPKGLPAMKDTHCADCADCGAEFKPAQGTTGDATTRVRKHDVATARSRYVPTRFEVHPLAFRALYDVEGQEGEDRRICLDCSAVLEKETMIARGKAGLYLVENSDDKDYNPHFRRTMSGTHYYRYEVTSLFGNGSKFPLIGRVNESKCHGFGVAYDVRTFRFRGPDGYIWSGRCAGDMQLARCKRTKKEYRR